MKIFLISAVLCLAGLAHGASIQRIARNTEAIIPTIVEEILKVELQSDLKKNSDVGVVEAEPIVMAIKEEIILDPLVSRTIEDGALPVEEKKPEIVEVVAVEQIAPEPIPATRTAEALPEIVEKVEVIAIQENVEKPVDNFRTESVPTVELPMAEIIKETIVAEPVSELRDEPIAEVIIKEKEVVIKEEEAVKPMIRNVVKEEIPQIKELTKTVPEEMNAIKETLPEPVASLNIAEPAVEVESPQVKNLIAAPIAPEIKEELLPELPLMKVEEPKEKLIVEAPLATEIKEEKMEVPAPIIPEVKKLEENLMTEVKAEPEMKPVPEIIAPSIEGSEDPEIRQSDRPTIVQQVQDAIGGAIANVPIVGPLFNRNPSTAASDEAVGDEAAATPTTTRPGPFQQAQQIVQNVITAFNPASNNAAGEGNQPQGPLAAVAQFASNAVGALQNAAQNIINPARDSTTTTAKPAIVADEKPEKPEEVKSVEPEPVVAVDPVVVQKEASEVQKVVEEEKENLVKH